jgi:Tfp pilus assembly protein PilW
LTITELLIAVAIFVAIGGALAVSLLMDQRAFVTSESFMHVQQQARRALDAMVKELRESGNIDSPTTSPNQDVTNTTRLNFQIARSYDDALCGGICWGNDATTGGWIHYLLDTTNATNVRLMRCQSGASDTVIADFGGGTCPTTLSNDVQTFQADYTNSTKTVTVRLENRLASSYLATGSVRTTPAPLRTQVKLRNP